MPFKPFRVVIINDIVYGSDKPCDGQLKSLPSRALSLLRYLVNRLNTELRPEFVVRLGSLIEDEDSESDEDNYDTALDVLKQLSMPVYHVVGSNEQINLSTKRIAEILKYPKLHYSFDAGDFHFVALFSKSENHESVHISEEQRRWLQEDLEASKKPTVVFVHHLLDEQDLSDNFWYQQFPNGCLVEEREELRAILARSGKVKAVFSGSTHQNNLQEHDGICYVTLQSLVENLSKAKGGKTASESFTILTLSPREIRVEIEGLDRAEYSIST
jgi:hypothetical protein